MSLPNTWVSPRPAVHEILHVMALGDDANHMECVAVGGVAIRLGGTESFTYALALRIITAIPTA